MELTNEDKMAIIGLIDIAVKAAGLQVVEPALNIVQKLQASGKDESHE